MKTQDMIFLGAAGVALYLLYKHLEDSCQTSNAGMCSLYHNVFGGTLHPLAPAATTTTTTTPAGTPQPSGGGPTPASQLPASVITPDAGGTMTIQPYPLPAPASMVQHQGGVLPPDPLVTGMSLQVGRTIGTVSEWNWIYRHVVDADGPDVVVSPYGNEQISVAEYRAARRASGLAGIVHQSLLPVRWIHHGRSR